MAWDRSVLRREKAPPDRASQGRGCVLLYGSSMIRPFLTVCLFTLISLLRFSSFLQLVAMDWWQCGQANRAKKKKIKHVSYVTVGGYLLLLFIAISSRKF
jgi:hypothetical protein